MERKVEWGLSTWLLAFNYHSSGVKMSESVSDAASRVGWPHCHYPSCPCYEYVHKSRNMAIFFCWEIGNTGEFVEHISWVFVLAFSLWVSIRFVGGLCLFVHEVVSNGVHSWVLAMEQLINLVGFWKCLFYMYCFVSILMLCMQVEQNDLTFRGRLDFGIFWLVFSSISNSLLLVEKIVGSISTWFLLLYVL